MKLYDINKEVQTVQNLLEEWAFEHEGDISDFPLEDNLKAIVMAREDKLLAIACIIKEYESEAAAIDAEAKKLEKRKRSAQNKVESMRDWLEMNIDAGESFKNAQAVIGWRKSQSVEVLGDVMDLPDIYRREKITIEPDKTKIKEALSRGEIITGCSIVHKNNIQVK